MTIGEKIKEARKQCALTQEKLAEKMNVSRSAVAKWETNKGLPDFDNLKMLSLLLNVSVDYLVDDEKIIDEYVTCEPYTLSDYGKGSRKRKKDRVIRERFPDAKIYTLLSKVKLTKSEKIIDNLLGLFTDAPFGIPDLINSFKNMDKEFYLVECNEKQFLVSVNDEFIETQQLTKLIAAEKFEIGNRQFVKCSYEIKQK